MLLWGATYYVRYVKRDANDSLCTTWIAFEAGCGTIALEYGTTALAVIAQIKTDATQHVIHIRYTF